AFSIKTFAGAMLALWIAFSIDLDRPYWAMATAYIVAQPLSGAMRSKGVYRFWGTVLGGIAVLVLVPNLVNAPELLVAALTLWTGACIYFVGLDRTPRSYVFLLAGYSAALIGFPSVDTPGAVWDIVIARVEEITLGIICTTVIGSVVFPRPLGPAVAARVDAWLQNAAAWTMAVLSGDPDSGEIRSARRRVAADAVELGMLTSHLAYDTSNLQVATRPVMLLQQRVVILLPLVSGIADRLAALRVAGGLTTKLQALLDRLAGWIRAGRSGGLEEAEGLHAAIDALEPAIDARSSWVPIMLSGLLVRLRELTDVVHDIKALRRQIAAGNPALPKLAFAPTEREPTPQHRDHVMALYSAVAGALAIALVCAYWIAAAWPEGGGAAALTAIAVSFFATQDDPVPSILKFLGAAVIALVIDAVYLFAILPLVHDFEMLVLALAPVYLFLGLLMAMPPTAPIGGPIAFIAATELALSSSYNADFAAFTNGGIAAIVGLALAAIAIRLVRSVGAEWTAERLLRRNRRDIADAALQHGIASRTAFVVLILDRLGLVVPRLAASAQNADAAVVSALADLRVGVNIVELRQHRASLPLSAHASVDAMLKGVAAHYRQRISQPPDPLVLDMIDRAIAAVTATSVAALPDLLRALVGLRRALFPEAPPYVPNPAEPGPPSQEAA
ncbi:MAG TPA: FUSC family protein, partial [Stellaceae bacterium]|nr:FUSC family protein [Stellaceae bacterium]